MQISVVYPGGGLGGGGGGGAQAPSFHPLPNIEPLDLPLADITLVIIIVSHARSGKELIK